MTANPPPATIDAAPPTVRLSPINRIIVRLFSLPTPLLLLMAGAALVLPFVLAWLDGTLDQLLAQGSWRLVLVPPLISIYILVLVPVMSRIDTQIAASILPILAMDDDAYRALLQRNSAADSRASLIAFLFGGALGLLSLQPWDWGPDGLLSNSYLLLSTILMYGLLAWVIVESIRATQITNTLLRQPLTVDVFDLSPFEPIGRQSLMLTFSFVVGITISILFISSVENIFNVGSLVVYALLLMLSVLLFFLNMRPTHAVLAAAKDEALVESGRRISRLYGRLQALDAPAASQEAEAATIAAELNAWIAMEARLKQARTWPYNTEMLRTLTVTVLTPVAIAFSRIVVFYLQSQL